MKVVEVKKIDKKKSKIIFDDGTVFALYNGEIFKYRITEGTVLDSEEYNAIKIILRKRARERCLYLLKDSDKTVKQIKDKLKLGYYPDDIINETIVFLVKYNYLNDERYCKNYIKSKLSMKSLKQIKEGLYAKGISSELIKDVLEDDADEFEFNNEELIRKLLIKRKFDRENDDYAYKGKVLAYVVSKGFDYSEVISVMNRF
ncbi:MAG: regulatory protein RecX [Lachnospiraceae bacterium]|nr:regulatory protein RecX [Lachnospiraceae bacterium]